MERLKKEGILLLAVLLAFSFSLAGLPLKSEKKPQVIPPETSRMTALRLAVDQQIDTLSDCLIKINDWMYNNPEPGFLEFKAAAKLTEELKKHGFEVGSGVPGLGENFDKLKVIGGFPADYSGPPGIPTAFKAKYKGKSEHPVSGWINTISKLDKNFFPPCSLSICGRTSIL